MFGDALERDSCGNVFSPKWKEKKKAVKKIYIHDLPILSFTSPTMWLCLLCFPRVYSHGIGSTRIAT